MLRLIWTLAVTLVPTVAFAHPGHEAIGLAQGFAHPIGGLDHVLAMVAVGLLAARIGGRMLWALPLAFMGAMVIGGAAGLFGVPLPFGEAAIAMSIVALGIAIARDFRLPVALTGAVTLFGLVHGHAHGAEMPESISAIGYALGFVAATGALHLSGIALGLVSARLAPPRSGVWQALGGATALVGLGFLGVAL